MTAYTLPQRLGPLERIAFRLPILGRILKEVCYGAPENIYYALATFVCLWGILVMLFGDGTSTTVATGLALASFSMLYGVLLALPAGCAVVWLERDA